MAEFCRECFIEKLLPTQEEINSIIMSEEDGFCEGCGQYGKFVWSVNAHTERNGHGCPDSVMTDDEKIDYVASRILKKYKEAFQELAK